MAAAAPNSEGFAALNGKAATSCCVPISFSVAASEIAARPGFLAGPLAVARADVLAISFAARPLPALRASGCRTFILGHDSNLRGSTSRPELGAGEPQAQLRSKRSGVEGCDGSEANEQR